MIAGIDWNEVDLAGAFILGAALATVATIAIVRAVSRTMRVERRRFREEDREE